MRSRLNGLIDTFIQDDRYKINEDGSIIRIKDNKKLGYSKKTEMKMRGKQYLYVKYQGKELKVHRIVYRKFIGELVPKMVIHHKDANGFNNAVTNLEQIIQELNLMFKGAE